VTDKKPDSYSPQGNPTGCAATVQDQPLGLTVHAMPQLNQHSTRTPHTRAGRWKMLAVLLVCASPVVASYFTYYVVRPEGRRNFGDLIDPQRPLPAVATQTLNGRIGKLTDLKDQWLLISVASGACDVRCEQNLYFQRQLRESLGKEKDRVDRVWLVNDEAPVATALQPALASATVLRVAPTALAQWLQPAAGQRLEDHIYVVDPLGNWMMRFPANMDAAAAASAKRDLERLMRASSSWDKEGR
jgi:hypothetical protein